MNNNIQNDQMNNKYDQSLDPTSKGQMDSNMFGRSDFTNKIPPKFNSKINPRLKPNSNSTTDNIDNNNNTQE